jgi:hypothetical protein
MGAHLKCKEHHNRCMKMARSAEALLCIHTRMDGIATEQVRTVQRACVECVTIN